ncbi:MAG TPA: formylmethanofuran dehydrogenase subunit C [Gemmataceae bacterium]|nr:formylmethanofuran dehydrogenase subunit C [Gemmataceae bacterium]
MLRLRYHGVTTIPIEAECITPDTLAGKSAAEIAALPVQHGNASVPLSEFFHIEGDPNDGDIVIEGDCGRVKWLGADMTRGRLTIHGNAGMHTGAEMKGGALHVYGQAGDWAGAEMRGGLLHVHGDAGHLAGAAYRGSRAGMRGGVLLIDGKAGHEIGATMRGGLIAVGGASGDFPGVSMIAGSIFLFGPSGGRPGAGMKRGTLAFFSSSPPLLPTFRPACDYRPVFLSLYLRQLRAWGFAVDERFQGGRWRRWTGDQVPLGKGEILLWQET